MFGLSQKEKQAKAVRNAISAFQDFIQNALEAGSSPDEGFKALEGSVKYYGKRGMSDRNVLVLLIIGCYHHHKKMTDEFAFYEEARRQGVLTKDLEVTCTAKEMFQLFNNLLFK